MCQATPCGEPPSLRAFSISRNGQRQGGALPPSAASASSSLTLAQLAEGVGRPSGHRDAEAAERSPGGWRAAESYRIIDPSNKDRFGLNI